MRCDAEVDQLDPTRCRVENDVRRIDIFIYDAKLMHLAECLCDPDRKREKLLDRECFCTGDTGKIAVERNAANIFECKCDTGPFLQYSDKVRTAFTCDHFQQGRFVFEARDLCLLWEWIGRKL